MTGAGPSDQQQQTVPAEELPAPTSAVERANRMSAQNMLRSLAPLVVICVAFVGWLAFLRQDDRDPVRPIDPAPSIGRAAEYAAYPLEAPEDLPEGFRATDTDVTASPETPGSPVTLGIDYVTPADEYAVYVTSDDPDAPEVDDVLDGAENQGTVDVDGDEWTRATTTRDETVLFRELDGVTQLVTGSAGEDDLRTLAAAARPVAG
ncbi:DUF4245 domain-containing protein [Blastococcus sp. TF02A-26]|uniref:DUF4245 domain-containing protein n=1 Tax=Blastococcus sp. TF02A-26 TaxID=2250577 RepID=UPI000DE81BD2|nr:DUF4245 domain-containing protein [Blastococcus sp. TF02A-26]RBY85254.1 DUF4245 domain-containing protein [Blastococcus sp. TF02A-26]